MATVKAEFDGRVFVPCEAVDLPVGTKVGVHIPDPPRKLTAEEMQQWQEFLKELEASEPPFASFDEYLRYRRMQP